MGKKILFVWHDNDLDDPRSWSNLWTLTTFDGSYEEQQYSFSSGISAIEGFFGLQIGAHKRPTGGLVILIYQRNYGKLGLYKDMFSFDPEVISKMTRMITEVEGYDDDIDYYEIAKSAGLDAGQIESSDGILTLSFSRLKEEYPTLSMKAAFDVARDAADDEISVLSAFISGEGLGGTVVDAETGDELDSCGGFYSLSDLLDHFEYDEMFRRGEPLDDYSLRREMKKLQNRDEDDENYDDE